MQSPTKFGGVGRGTGPDGGLSTKSFPTSCPPDVQPNTRIIGLLGINDYKRAASPQEDGWFVVDNYLYHHLLEDDGCFKAANQVWLTCLEPYKLVNEYKEYAHGNPHYERHVVLDKEMLPRIYQPGNIRVVQPEILLERFLATLRSETKIAAELGQPVLVFVFGHGDLDFDIAIGGVGDINHAPRLTIEAFRAAVYPKASVCLVTTSCYSGGWIVKHNTYTGKPTLNISAMTAAGISNFSESWAQSNSSGRAGGAIFTTAMVKALIAISEKATSTEIDSNSPAYIAFCNSVHDSLKDIDRLHSKHSISFSSQDDRWSDEWRPRSGFPLKDYKTKFEQLRVIPKDYMADPHTDRDPSNPYFMDTTEPTLGATLVANCHIDETRGLYGAIPSIREQNIIRERARAYYLSFPGPDSYANNMVFHNRVRDFLMGKQKDFDAEDFENISNTLLYRHFVVERAIEFKDFLGLSCENGFKIDPDAWVTSLLERLNSGPGEDRDRAQTLRERYKHLYDYIFHCKLFDKALPYQGLTYLKPNQYLAMALAQSTLDLDEAQAAIDKCLMLKNAGDHAVLTKTRVGDIVCKNTKVRKYGRSFFQSIGRSIKRLRTPSPTKSPSPKRAS